MTTSTKHHCPRCHVPMKSATAGETTALGCRSCGGVMIDVSSVEKMRSEPDARQLADSAATTSWSANVDTTIKGIACPHCTMPMEHQNLFGVDIDVCPSHGTWFDRNELQQIVESARGGAAGKAALGGAALIGGAAVVGGVAASTQADQFEQLSEGVQRQALVHDPGILVDGAVVAADVASYGVASGAVEVGADIGASALEVGAGAAELTGAALEGAGSVFGSVLEVLGSLFS